MPFGVGTCLFWQGQRGGRGRFAKARGRGRMYQGQPSFSGHVPQDFTQPVSKERELELLKQQPQQLEQQLDVILKRINDLAKKSKQKPSKSTVVKAFIDEIKCTGCSVCINVCPQRAITIRNIARVNTVLCTGCGKCVKVCPNKAIYLRRV
ncbi:4Fe-4S binding protein [bacterium]|nr:4Fe-4S binding protein [bacterium]